MSPFSSLDAAEATHVKSSTSVRVSSLPLAARATRPTSRPSSEQRAVWGDASKALLKEDTERELGELAHTVSMIKRVRPLSLPPTPPTLAKVCRGH